MKHLSSLVTASFDLSMSGIRLLLILQFCYDVLALGCTVRQVLLETDKQSLLPGKHALWNSDRSITVTCLGGKCKNSKACATCKTSAAGTVVNFASVYFFTTIGSDGNAVCDFTYEYGIYNPDQPVQDFCG
jgi:hypothetical protein